MVNYIAYFSLSSGYSSEIRSYSSSSVYTSCLMVSVYLVSCETSRLSSNIFYEIKINLNYLNVKVGEGVGLFRIFNKSPPGGVCNIKYS
jgi:hypothetical protein